MSDNQTVFNGQDDESWWTNYVRQDPSPDSPIDNSKPSDDAFFEDSQPIQASPYPDTVPITSTTPLHNNVRSVVQSSSAELSLGDISNHPSRLSMDDAAVDFTSATDRHPQSIVPGPERGTAMAPGYAVGWNPDFATRADRRQYGKVGQDAMASTLNSSTTETMSEQSSYTKSTSCNPSSSSSVQTMPKEAGAPQISIVPGHKNSDQGILSPRSAVARSNRQNLSNQRRMEEHEPQDEVSKDLLRILAAVPRPHGLDDNVAEVCRVWVIKNPGKEPSILDVTQLGSLFGTGTPLLRQYFDRMLMQKSLRQQAIQAKDSDIISKFRGNRRNCAQVANWLDEFTRDPKKPFVCTSGCGKSFSTASGWAKHEGANWVQELWRCGEDRCKGKEPPKRRDHLKSHIKKIHDREATKEELRLGYTAIPGNFIEDCIFRDCDIKFSSWQKRLTHIRVHYKQEPWSKSRWRSVNGHQQAAHQFSGPAEEETEGDGEDADDKSDDESDSDNSSQGPDDKSGPPGPNSGFRDDHGGGSQSGYDAGSGNDGSSHQHWRQSSQSGQTPNNSFQYNAGTSTRTLKSLNLVESSIQRGSQPILMALRSEIAQIRSQPTVRPQLDLMELDYHPQQSEPAGLTFPTSTAPMSGPLEGVGGAATDFSSPSRVCDNCPQDILSQDVTVRLALRASAAYLAKGLSPDFSNLLALLASSGCSGIHLKERVTTMGNHMTDIEDRFLAHPWPSKTQKLQLSFPSRLEMTRFSSTLGMHNATVRRNKDDEQQVVIDCIISPVPFKHPIFDLLKAPRPRSFGYRLKKVASHLVTVSRHHRDDGLKISKLIERTHKVVYRDYITDMMTVIEKQRGEDMLTISTLLSEKQSLAPHRGTMEVLKISFYTTESMIVDSTIPWMVSGNLEQLNMLGFL